MIDGLLAAKFVYRNHVKFLSLPAMGLEEANALPIFEVVHLAPFF